MNRSLSMELPTIDLAETAAAPDPEALYPGASGPEEADPGASTCEVFVPGTPDPDLDLDLDPVFVPGPPAVERRGSDFVSVLQPGSVPRGEIAMYALGLPLWSLVFAFMLALEFTALLFFCARLAWGWAFFLTDRPPADRSADIGVSLVCLCVLGYQHASLYSHIFKRPLTASSPLALSGAAVAGVLCLGYGIRFSNGNAVKKIGRLMAFLASLVFPFAAWRIHRSRAVLLTQLLAAAYTAGTLLFTFLVFDMDFDSALERSLVALLGYALPFGGAYVALRHIVANSAALRVSSRPSRSWKSLLWPRLAYVVGRLVFTSIASTLGEMAALYAVIVLAEPRILDWGGAADPRATAARRKTYAETVRMELIVDLVGAMALGGALLVAADEFPGRGTMSSEQAGERLAVQIAIEVVHGAYTVAKALQSGVPAHEGYYGRLVGLCVLATLPLTVTVGFAWLDAVAQTAIVDSDIFRFGPWLSDCAVRGRRPASPWHLADYVR